MAELVNTCQACGAEESLDALLLRMIDDDQVRRLIADVITQSLPLGGMVVRYLRLHKPPKQRLRMSTVARLLGELVPDIQRSVIDRHGRAWAVCGDSWKAALQAVFDAVDKGSLVLPLQGNSYLYGVLTRLSDKTEAEAEAAREAERASAGRVRQGSMRVDGQAVSIGAALQNMRDPALAKLDADAARAAPMPAEVRARIQELKGAKA